MLWGLMVQGHAVFEARLPALRASKYASIVEVDESLRKRMGGSPHNNHEDHIAGKGMNSLSRCNLRRKFIPMRQAVKIPDAKAAVEKEWEKLEWELTKVKKQKRGDC